MMRHSVALTFFLLLSPPAAAQNSMFGGLEGHSIISDYEEELLNSSGLVSRFVWRDVLYFSTKGRIFHRSVQHGYRHNYRNEVVGDGASRGFSNGVFRWDGSGVVREWFNNRIGTKFRQSISITSGARGAACRTAVQRLGGTTVATVVRENCRVIKGNALDQ